MPRPPSAPSSARSLTLHSRSAQATQDLAAALAGILVDGDLLVLSGDLGAGKTTFAQGLGRALGITDRITSPTFTLANRYEGSLTLNHLDVYRIEELADTLDLDLPELLEEGVTVIEWGEQILPVLGDDFLLIRLRNHETDDDRRILEIEPSGARWLGRFGALVEAVEDWTPC